MKLIIINYLPYLLSVLTIYSLLLAGNNCKSAWIVGIIGQLLWFVWIYMTKAWGLALGAIVLLCVYIRNYIKWSKNK